MKTSISILLLATLPAAWLLAGCAGSGSTNSVQQFTQIDRIGRPEVAEICLTVANGQSQAYATSAPTADGTVLSPGIVAFATHAAGRSAQLANAAAAMLSPDAIVADVGQSGSANYLDIELNPGAAKFGGRKFTDDVVTADFTLLFGNTLGNDGAATPGLTTDNVTASTAPKHYQDGSAGFGAAAFPYLGAPR